MRKREAVELRELMGRNVLSLALYERMAQLVNRRLRSLRWAI